ncbi:MAG: hypothetical protein KJ077_08125 [Anaerolineae bacterium]|nr:hypothetical protein [Anaerolineae bacterium]
MLQRAVVGTIASQAVTWQLEDGTALDLTGKSITGTIQPADDVAAIRAIAGALAPGADPAAGQFTWTYAAGDVGTPGVYLVQFKAVQAPDTIYSFADYWIVEGTLPLARNSLSALRLKLMELVSARAQTPNFRQYTLAIMDAVADYSERKPLEKTATLAIVSGTASYDLPADFLRLVSLESATATDGVLISDAGLIPVSDTFRESYTIAGGRITFIPTPQYTATKRLWYGAAYLLDGDEIYADLGREGERLVMLKAQAIALQIQANRAAQEAWQYAIGDERVNKEKLAEALAKRAKEMSDEYEAVIEKQAGQVGLRSYYGLTE